MLSRICAGWLALLILLPFSAPFSTCDLAMILGSQDAAHADGSGTTTLAAPVAATHALPHTRTPHRDQWAALNAVFHLAGSVRPVSRVHRSERPLTIVGSPVLQPLRI